MNYVAHGLVGMYGRHLSFLTLLLFAGKLSVGPVKRSFFFFCTKMLNDFCLKKNEGKTTELILNI